VLAYGHTARLLRPTGIGPTVHQAAWLALIALAVLVAFRLLFNAYFDTDLPLLPDESFTHGHPEPLEFPEP